jgi:hypothetical protein
VGILHHDHSCPKYVTSLYCCCNDNHCCCNDNHCCCNHYVHYYVHYHVHYYVYYYVYYYYHYGRSRNGGVIQ